MLANTDNRQNFSYAKAQLQMIKSSISTFANLLSVVL